MEKREREKDTQKVAGKREREGTVKIKELYAK